MREREVLTSYLVHGMSHRKIQEEILQIPAPIRGGGYRAMDILHSFDIRADRKGILRNRSIDIELRTATGRYREALLMIM